MDKFLLILFFIIKILIIVIFPILLYIFKNKLSKKYYYIELILIICLLVLYLFNSTYIVDSNISSLFRFKLLSESKESNISKFKDDLEKSNIVSSIESIDKYKTHRNDSVYYFNGFEKPLATRKIMCEEGYDYFKYYSDLITSTSTLLSSYFNKTIDPIEVLEKANKYNLIKCNERINKDSFFYIIQEEYGIYFNVIKPEELENYILNGKIVLLETRGIGTLSCNESYFIIYNIDNDANYLLLDPNNKSYDYICPDGTKGFGNVIKANINENTFSYSSILTDANRFIVIGGTK